MQKTISILLSLFFSISLWGQDLYDEAHTRQFANFLYQSREFKLASVEYERLVFFDPTDTLASYYLIKSYRKQGNFRKGLSRANQLFPDNRLAPAHISREKALMLLHQRNYLTLFNYLDNSSLEGDDRMLFAVGGRLLQHDYATARSMAEAISPDSRTDLQTMRYLSEEALRLKYKSPVTSTLLSVLVPGLGKVYTGNWKDGIFSFLFTTVAIYQAYRGFDQRGINSIYGWGYAALGTGFYLGNLYGSYKAANKYNYQQRHALDHRVEAVFDRMD